jgi:hypothetical protein
MLVNPPNNFILRGFIVPLAFLPKWI